MIDLVAAASFATSWLNDLGSTQLLASPLTLAGAALIVELTTSIPATTERTEHHHYGGTSMTTEATHPASGVRRAAATTLHRLHVTGMTCGHCERVLTAALDSVAGITTVAVDATAGTVDFLCTAPLDLDTVAVAIYDAGYDLVR